LAGVIIALRQQTPTAATSAANSHTPNKTMQQIQEERIQNKKEK
jgi:hypothetical protein